MKYTLTINQKRSVEWELTASEAIVFSWLYELPSWAEKVEYDGNTYYFANRNVACKELPLITDKNDTMYRLYKSLERKGLVSMITLMKRDYIALTEKGKSWYYDDELPKLGKKSEETRNEIRENSEKNPTDKYTNNKYTSDKLNKKEENKEWRDNFEVYLELVNKAKINILNDAEFRQYIEKYYHNADYEATINKLIDGFWGKEEGWQYCKSKRKGKTINMTSAFKKNMDKREHIVYKQKQYKAQNKSVSSQPKTMNLRPDLKFVDDEGKLNDGTIIKNGYRYYYSKQYGRVFSIPYNAEPMPEGENIEYDLKLGWYECCE